MAGSISSSDRSGIAWCDRLGGVVVRDEFVVTPVTARIGRPNQFIDSNVKI